MRAGTNHPAARMLMRLLTVLLAALPWLILPVGANRAATQMQLPDYPAVVPGVALHFPRDRGAHPAFRTEWWYLTGWLRTATGKPLGFQVTFFRSRPPLDQRDPSQFAPKELLFGHAAIADPALGRLLHDQRTARAGFGLAEAAVEDTNVHIGPWSLVRTVNGTYHAAIAAQGFTLDLEFTPQQPVLLQGDQGYSRKGPQPQQSSYYYSEPQLAVHGSVARDGQTQTVTGTAWLDHEWSSEVLAAGAAGWDWTGINLADGGALMAFRIRNAGGQPLWAGGSQRDASGRVTVLQPQDVSFRALRTWHSPRTDVKYPVAMQVHAGALDLTLTPLMDDQELDTRASTGAVYWEGAVTATRGGKTTGHGYLELTGYYQPLTF